MKKEKKLKENQLRKDISDSIIAELKTLAVKFNSGSKKTEKAIAKSAKTLSKKMAKSVKAVPAPAPVVAATKKKATPATEKAK